MGEAVERVFWFFGRVFWVREETGDCEEREG